MIRTINVAENNLFADPPKVVALNAATSTPIFPSEQGLATGEIAYRYIQNVGANDVYYAFGVDNVDNVNYHGILPAKSQLDCSNHRLSVVCYSTLGSSVATTLIRRRDLTQ